jgi:hypothetical protein
MNSKLKNLIYAVSSIVIILPAILFASDYIHYSLPMEKMVLWESPEPDKIQKKFQALAVGKELPDHMKGSTCFRTVTDGYFCYPTPSFHSKEFAASWMVSNTTQAYGEIHFDLVEKDCKPDLRSGACGDFYYTLKDIVPMSDGKALVTFADRNYRVGNSTTTLYEITDKFEFSRVLEEFDTFITKCDNYAGTSVTLIQYLGIKEIEDNDYFMTWHFNAEVDDGITCKYPEIIQYSLNHNFVEQFGLPTDITLTVTRSNSTVYTFTEINVNDCTSGMGFFTCD